MINKYIDEKNRIDITERLGLITARLITTPNETTVDEIICRIQSKDVITPPNCFVNAEIILDEFKFIW